MSAKKVSQSPATPVDSEKYTPLGSILTRIYWMVFGHFGIVILAFVIASNNAPWFVNFIYFLLVASIIVIRYVDITVYKGETVDGDPATLKDWRRYSLIVLGYTVLLYTAVKVVAHFKIF